MTTATSVRLVSVQADELETMRDAPATFAARAGLRLEADAMPPDFVIGAAIERLHAEPQHARFHALRLFVVDDQVTGSACFKSAPDEGEIEIGYGVAPSWQHRGVGTAACRLLCAEAFAAGVATVIAHTSPANEPSWRLLQSAGFVRDGDAMDPEDGPLWIWRLDRMASSAGPIERSAHALS